MSIVPRQDMYQEQITFQQMLIEESIARPFTVICDMASVIESKT